MHIVRQAAIIAAVLASAATAAAQDIEGSGTFGTLQLNNGFLPDPQTVEIAAGGGVDSSQTIGGRCRGYIANNPDYTLNYAAGDLPLYVSVDSQTDTTLVIYAPDGMYYCDDDSAGELDPGVYLPKPASGRYQIWVGNFASGQGAPPATIYISELNYVHALAGDPDNAAASVLGAPGATPNYGSVSLIHGFTPDPFTVAVRAGGGNPINDTLDQCRGYVSTNPDFRLDWTGGGSLPLIISAASDTDTTLVIRGPDGAISCDDDSGDQGMNPSVSYPSSLTGSYDIWVGSYSAEASGAAAVLHISELTTQ